jgi:hypothetical protein
MFRVVWLQAAMSTNAAGNSEGTFSEELWRRWLASLIALPAPKNFAFRTTLSAEVCGVPFVV